MWQANICLNQKDTALDFTVPTGGADLRSLAPQPGSAMGGLNQVCVWTKSNTNLKPNRNISKIPFHSSQSDCISYSSEKLQKVNHT